MFQTKYFWGASSYFELLANRFLTVLLREIVLGRVSALVKQFVKKVSLDHGLSEVAANTAGGKIFTFGSYRLGVHGPGTDIDTLCVVPKHVSREDFFDVFEPMLKETEGATEVSVSYFRSILPLCRIDIQKGSTRSLCTNYQSRDQWDPIGFSHGSFSIIFGAGQPVFEG